jgi:hypothetical protein
MLLPPCVKLHCCPCWLAELPDSFYTPNEHECVGYMEWGFLSTTLHWQTAIDYSCAGKDKPLPIVIQT